MKYIVITLVFCIEVLGSLNGQGSWNPTTLLQLPQGEGKFFNQFEDPIADRIYNVYEKEEGRKKIKSQGCHKLRKFISTSIITETGEKINLPPNEKVFSIRNNKLISIDRDYERFQVKLKNYDLGESSLGEVNNELIIDHGEVRLSYIENSGHIIIDDLMYGLGFLFEIYSPELSGLYRYVPFKEGYTHVAVGGNDDQLIIASTPKNDSQSMKIGFFDPITGVKQQEIQTNISGMRVKQVYAFQNLFILYSSYEDRGRKLHAFDMQGNFLWEKECTLPNFHKGIGLISDAEEEVIYANSYTMEISAINAESGQTLWTVDLDKFYDQDEIENDEKLKNEGLRLMDFQLDDAERVLALTGQMTWDGDESSSFKYQNNQLLTLDSEGKLERKLNLEQDGNKIKLQGRNGQVKLISPNKNVSYEKF